MGGKPQERPTVQQRAKNVAQLLLVERPELSGRGRLRELSSLVAAEMMEAEGWKSLERAQSRVYDYLVQAKLREPPTGIEALSGPESVSPDEFDAVWMAAEATNDRAIATKATRGRATFQVHESQPFGVLLSSDEHLENSGCDLRTLRDMTSVVATTDGLYAGLHGDIRDNFIIRGLIHARFGAKHHPKIARDFADKYLSMFGPQKVLWLVAGNHDNWEKKMTGMEAMEDLAARNGILYDSDQFNIKLKCDGVDYRLFIRHKWRMNSSYNDTHSCKQLLRMGVAPSDTDVIAMGHHHQPAIEYWEWDGRRRLAIKTGSAKRGDEYAHEMGFAEGGFMAPVLIFWPDRRKVLVFPDYREGAEYLKYLRRAA